MRVGDIVREVVWRVGWNVGGENQEQDRRLNRTSYTRLITKICCITRILTEFCVFFLEFYRLSICL